jgi:hypothetical protein
MAFGWSSYYRRPYTNSYGRTCLGTIHAYIKKSLVALVKGVSDMPEFIVAIDHITYYAVQAQDEVTAIDLVLEGQGEEVSSDTRDAYITEYQSSDPRRDS